MMLAMEMDPETRAAAYEARCFTGPSPWLLPRRAERKCAAAHEFKHRGPGERKWTLALDSRGKRSGSSGSVGALQRGGTRREDSNMGCWKETSGSGRLTLPASFAFPRKKELGKWQSRGPRQREAFAPHVMSISPTHGPRSGGTVLLLRGTGFGSIQDQITVLIGPAPFPVHPLFCLLPVPRTLCP